jgi:hypothetical protein
LHFVATVLPEKRELRLVLDAFGDDIQLESVRHREKRFRNRGVFPVHDDASSKRLVDLQRVQRKVLEIVKHRVSGAEVVHGEADTHAPEMQQHVEGWLVVAHDAPLGNLDLELSGADFGLFENTGHRSDEPGSA